MTTQIKLGPNEEIKFIGSYDITKAYFNLTPDRIVGNVGIKTDVNGVCGNNFISNNFVETKSNLSSTQIFSDETYSMVSYPDLNNKLPKIGSIIWSGLYDIPIVGGATLPTVQEFMITSSSGIYQMVNKVIIDFINVIRVLYFIGPKNL